MQIKVYELNLPQDEKKSLNNFATRYVNKGLARHKTRIVNVYDADELIAALKERAENLRNINKVRRAKLYEWIAVIMVFDRKEAKIRIGEMSVKQKIDAYFKDKELYLKEIA